MRAATTLAALAILLAGALPGAAAQAEPPAYVLTFDALPEGVTEGSIFHGGRVEHVDTALGFARVRLDEAARRSVVDDLVVRSIEPEVRMTTQLIPDDPGFAQQYGPQQVRAPAAWDTTPGSTAITICVLDTGVRHTHEDLAGARWRGGVDLINGDDDPWDDNGHGTHVAGIAAATLGNARGVAGVAQAAILGVKVLDANGGGSTSIVASGVRWCADQGAQVITMSLGSSRGTSALASAIAYATAKGSLVFAAAGNSGPCTDCVAYPAAYPAVVAVTCTTQTQALCGFSSTGPQAELAAPGHQILSAGHAGDAAYVALSGTSMSTPHAAGVAALVWGAAPTLTAAQVRQSLATSAVDLGETGRDARFGHGRVDAKDALDAALAVVAPPPAPQPAPQPAPVPGPAPAPRAPIADAGPDQTIETSGLGLAWVRLDGSGSKDADGRIVRREWREGERVLSSLTSPLVAMSLGTHTVKLTVWDDDDASASDEVVVRVVAKGSAPEPAPAPAPEPTPAPPANAAPVADAGADQTLADARDRGAAYVKLDASGSTDADGRVVKYAWHEGGRLLSSSRAPSLSLTTGRHDITLTVTDDKGATATDDVVVVVEPNRAPTASFTASCEGLVCRFDASTSVDPDGELTSLRWTMGDGRTGWRQSFDHRYAKAGTYAATLTVRDNGGATSAMTVDVVVA